MIPSYLRDHSKVEGEEKVEVKPLKADAVLDFVNTIHGYILLQSLPEEAFCYYTEELSGGNMVVAEAHEYGQEEEIH
jgi:hypothetical protein